MTAVTGDAFAPIVVVDRNGVDESLHVGAGVALDSDGVVSSSVGDPDVEIYPRSVLKIFQANAMVRNGLDIPQRLLAMVTASHSGERPHLDAVRELLDRFDLGPSDLENTAALPYGEAARHDAIAGGVSPSSLMQNCSGKHAAMLATCRVNDWSINGYLARTHPLQVAICAEIDRLVGHAAIRSVGVDGCGAPTHVLALRDVALGASALARERSAVLDAMQAYPKLVGGVDRDVTLWMEHIPGLAVKEGAAGVMMAARRDGSAGALKIADGSDVARRCATVELLRQLGVDVDGEFAPVVHMVRAHALGHGQPVGTFRAVAW